MYFLESTKVLSYLYIRVHVLVHVHVRKYESTFVLSKVLSYKVRKYFHKKYEGKIRVKSG